LFDKYRWRNRILVVLSDDDAFAFKQREFLNKDRDGVLNRDLVVIGLGDEGAPYFEDVDIELDQVRERFSLGSGDKIILFGKDGTLKKRWGTPVTTDELFSLIDAMPMRKAEMRRKSSEPS
jgi:hypothetical protein